MEAVSAQNPWNISDLFLICENPRNLPARAYLCNIISTEPAALLLLFVTSLLLPRSGRRVCGPFPVIPVLGNFHSRLWITDFRLRLKSVIQLLIVLQAPVDGLSFTDFRSNLFSVNQLLNCPYTSLWNDPLYKSLTNNIS